MSSPPSPGRTRTGPSPPAPSRSARPSPTRPTGPAEAGGDGTTPGNPATMKISVIAVIAGGIALAPGLARAQQVEGPIRAQAEPKRSEPAPAAPAPDSIEAIDREFASGLERLERQ